MNKLTLVIILLITLLAMGAVTVYAQATREGKNFTQQKTTAKTQDIQTEYTYTINDKVYPIWITKNGRCYIKRIAKSGNEYRSYLPKEICLEICKELGIKYIEK